MSFFKKTVAHSLVRAGERISEHVSFEVVETLEVREVTRDRCEVVRDRVRRLLRSCEIVLGLCEIVRAHVTVDAHGVQELRMRAK
eukprot:6182564-Pleurochrysis_carterae.AAC.1